MTIIRDSLLIDGLELPLAFAASLGARSALLLIPGSMNSDVDGNYAPMFPGQPAMRPHLYADLAGQLATFGVATLRYAKSGPGTGAVVRDEALAGNKFTRFPQRVRVAAAFLEELRRRAPGLAVILAGHSEGAVVATVLAQTNDVAGLVLLSAPAKPLLQLMMWQKYLEDADAGDLTSERAAEYAAAQRAGEDYAAGRPVAAEALQNRYASMLHFFLQPANEIYLRSLEQVDPRVELGRTHCPVLIVQGGRDRSVRAENVELLRQARPDACVALFPTLQHFYKHAPDGIDALASFALDGESDPAVARAIADWLAAGGLGAATEVEK